MYEEAKGTKRVVVQNDGRKVEGETKEQTGLEKEERRAQEQALQPQDVPMHISVTSGSP